MTAGGEQWGAVTARGLGSPRNGMPTELLPSGRYEFGKSRLDLRPVVDGWRPPRKPRPWKPRPEPVQVPVQRPVQVPVPAERCEDCGYLRTAPGHEAACGNGGPA